MKRLFVLIFVVFVAVLLVGCKKTKEYEIALITDVGTIDDKSFNQGTWEGVKAYAEDNDISHKYYKPAHKSTQDYLDAIDLAVKGGAKVIVTPGFLFEPAIYEAQDKYPDIKFILIDGTPNNKNWDTGEGEFRIEDNVYSIFYAEEQSGFLAGYAAVKEGFTKLGFMGGMAVPAVVRFGYGYLQGAEYAASEMGLEDGSIDVSYHYLGDFGPKPEFQTMAASWYSDGIEVIFAAAGGAGGSVMKAAESATDKYVIGVDVDQSGDSTTVITSAKKELANSVYQCLDVIYNENSEYKSLFTIGASSTMNASNNGVGLPEDFTRFPNQTFTSSNYDEIFNKLKNEDITVISALAGENVDLATYLGLAKVDLTIID